MKCGTQYVSKKHLLAFEVLKGANPHSQQNTVFLISCVMYYFVISWSCLWAQRGLNFSVYTLVFILVCIYFMFSKVVVKICAFQLKNMQFIRILWVGYVLVQMLCTYIKKSTYVYYFFFILVQIFTCNRICKTIVLKSNFYSLNGWMLHSKIIEPG